VSTATAAFLVIGGVSLLALGLSLFGGHLHIGHLHIGHLHIGHLRVGHWRLGHAGRGGDHAFSLPALAGFVGAFGFAGAAAAELTGSTVLAVLAGVAAAVPAGWLAGRLTRAAMEMRTDATLGQQDLVGATGVVIRAVPTGGYGEVRLAVAGQQMKFHARAAGPLPAGTWVLVIDAPSPTSVVVETTDLLG